MFQYSVGLCSTSQGSRRICVFASFCTQEMLSTPPATITAAPSVMMRCAAKAMDCNPELQKRLMLKPAVVTGSPARSAMARAILPPVVPSPKVQTR